MKRCTKCGESLPLDAFGRLTASVDGLQSACKRCRLAAKAVWRQSARARGLPAESTCHGTLTGYVEWGCRCDACVSVRGAYRRAWRQTVRTAGLPAEATQHGTRSGYVDRGCRCDACSAAAAAAYRAWREANPDIARVRHRRRRARKAGVESVPYRDVDIIARDREVGCYLCHRPLPDDRQAIHLDHRVPLVRGGADTPENVFAVHATCNLTKGALSEDEARARILAYA